MSVSHIVESIQVFIQNHDLGLPAQFWAFILSMVPVTESRLGIPVGVLLGLSPWQALLWGWMGNVFVVILTLTLLPYAVEFGRRYSKWLDSVFQRLFAKTRTEHSKRMSEVGHLALFMFVALPLPGSGGIGASLISYLFGIKKSTALLLITAGLFIGGIPFAFGVNFIDWILGLF